MVTIHLSFLEYYSEFLNLKAIRKILLQKIAIKQDRVLSDSTFNLILLHFLHASVVKFKTLSYFLDAG